LQPEIAANVDEDPAWCLAGPWGDDLDNRQ